MIDIIIIKIAIYQTENSKTKKKKKTNKQTNKQTEKCAIT